MNVTLDGEDRSQHALSAAKEQGRLKLGRLGSMLGGVMGSVAGKSTAFDNVIAERVRGAVETEVVEALRRRRWWAHVTPVLLPPMPGKSDWNKYVSLGEKGHFMIFRVKVLGKLPGEEEAQKAESSGFSLASLSCLFAACMTPEVKEEEEEDPDVKAAREIELLHPEVVSALQSRQNPIFVKISVADAHKEYRIFHELNWSRELASEAVLSARRTEGQSVAVA